MSINKGLMITLNLLLYSDLLARYISMSKHGGGLTLLVQL